MKPKGKDFMQVDGGSDMKGGCGTEQIPVVGKLHGCLYFERRGKSEISSSCKAINWGDKMSGWDLKVQGE